MTATEDVPLGVIALLSVIAVFGFASNTMVCLVVFFTPKLRNVTSLFIFNLAVADMFYSSISLPLKVVSMANISNWTLGNAGCKIVMFSPMFSITCSIYTMVAISHERRVAILSGINSKMGMKRAQIIICLIWIASLLVSIPQMYEYSTYQKIILNEVHSGSNSSTSNTIMISNDTNLSAGGTAQEEADIPNIIGAGSSEEILIPVNFTDYYHVLACGSYNIKESFEEIYSVCIFVVAYLIPLVIILVNYTVLTKYIWKRSKAVATHGTASAVSKKKVKVVKMLITVVVVFAMCWAPFFALFVREEVLGLDDSRESASIMHSLKLTLAALSTVSNPIIYAAFNKNFREGFKAVYRCKLRNNNRVGILDGTTENPVQASIGKPNHGSDSVV